MLTLLLGRKLEVEKKGSDLSIEQALSTLGLQMNGDFMPEEKSIRKAYFKLASKLVALSGRVEDMYSSL